MPKSCQVGQGQTGRWAGFRGGRLSLLGDPAQVFWFCHGITWLGKSPPPNDPNGVFLGCKLRLSFKNTNLDIFSGTMTRSPHLKELLCALEMVLPYRTFLLIVPFMSRFSSDGRFLKDGTPFWSCICAYWHVNTTLVCLFLGLGAAPSLWPGFRDCYARLNSEDK